jgi:hypothetical protein
MLNRLRGGLCGVGDRFLMGRLNVLLMGWFDVLLTGWFDARLTGWFDVLLTGWFDARRFGFAAGFFANRLLGLSGRLAPDG